MTILFDPANHVKSSRHFGRGLLAAAPVYRTNHTAADDAWLLDENLRREEEDAILDERHTCLEQMDRDAVEHREWEPSEQERAEAGSAMGHPA